MKKNAIKLNEQQLKNIITKSIKKMLNEDFRNVDNLSDYIRQNNIQMRQASKFARIQAVQARGGERINTIASDGTQETTNVAKPGDWIVNNVGNPNNKWIIDAATFAKKYQPDPTQQGVYMPKGGPMMAGQINEPISFNAPWGERMNIDKGGYLLQTPGSETDIYGISGPDFDSTYRYDSQPQLESKQYKNVKLNESQLRKIVAGSVKKVLNEVNSNTVVDASMKADDNLRELNRVLKHLHDATCYMAGLVSNNDFHVVDDGNRTRGAQIYGKMKSLEQELLSYIKRKKEQHSTFEDDANKLYDAGFERV